jgi:ribosomal RNA-processing protein 8
LVVDGAYYLPADVHAMFAVEGWNLSSPALAQQNAQSRSGQDGSNGPSKKRKRLERDSEKSKKIKPSDLGKLWDQVVGESNHSNKSEPQNGAERTSKKSHASHQTPDEASGDGNSRPAKKQDKRQPGAEIAAARPQAVGRHQKKTVDLPEGGQPRKNGVSVSTKIVASHAKNMPSAPPASANLTPLQAKMRSKLTSARFRHLNETLYTTDSKAALSLFASSPDLFAEYHAGFSQQVSSSWPRNPVDDFVDTIKRRGPANNTDQPLPRRKTQSCTIADLGCGDAPLARALIPSFTKKMQLTIHSYDLHAPNQHVTVSDIANLPLRDGEADIAIFCLSLMGINWVDFVDEAWRILRGDGKGEVWVAEVKSRFGRSSASASGGGTSLRPGEAVAHSVGKRQKPHHQTKVTKRKTGDEGEADEADLPSDLFTSSDMVKDQAAAGHEGDTPDLRPFIDVFTRRGFQLKPQSVDARNKMFVSMTFFKSGIPTAGKHKGMKWNGKQYERIGKKMDDMESEQDRVAEGKVLKPCVYKSR